MIRLLGWVWLDLRDYLSWETGGSVVGRVPLFGWGAELARRLAVNNTPADTTVLPTEHRRPAAVAALAAAICPIHARWLMYA